MRGKQVTSQAARRRLSSMPEARLASSQPTGRRPPANAGWDYAPDYVQ